MELILSSAKIPLETGQAPGMGRLPESVEERTNLWSVCFGDEREEILAFFSACSPDTMCLEAKENGHLLGALYLVPAVVAGKDCLYGYAVGTFPEHRGKGVCRELHKSVYTLCIKQDKGYFLHPATPSLFTMYQSFGMTPCGSVREKRIEVPRIPASSPVTLEDTAPGTFRGAPLIRWEKDTLKYAMDSARRYDGFCKTAKDGAVFLGRAEKDELLISYCSRDPTTNELAVLAAPYDVTTAVLRLPGDTIPYLLGYNMPVSSFYTDVILD